MTLLLKRIQILGALITTLCVLFVLFYPMLTRRSEMTRSKLENQEKIKQVEEEIATLEKREFEFHNNPFYVETLARNKLGYSRPGEIVYKFEDASVGSSVAKS